jgi:hypothetical protein
MRTRRSWLSRNAGVIVLVAACVLVLVAWRWCVASGNRAQTTVPTTTPTDDLDLVALLHDGGAANEAPVNLVAARAGIIYVARADDRTIVATPAPSGAPTTLMHLPEPAWGLALDDASAWVTSTRNGGGVLERLALAGQAQPAVVASGFTRPRAVTSDGTNVFLVDAGAHGSGLLSKSTIVRIPVAGGDSVKIATVEGVVSGVALDAANVYWADSLEGAVLAAPKTGGMPHALLHDRGLPRDVVIDGDALVWVEQRSESLWTVPASGGVPRQIVQDFGGFTHLVASARGVWWTNETAVDGSYRVFLMAHGAAEPVPVTPAVDAIEGLASDGARVYWLHGGHAEPVPQN